MYCVRGSSLKTLFFIGGVISAFRAIKALHTAKPSFPYFLYCWPHSPYCSDSTPSPPHPCLASHTRTHPHRRTPTHKQRHTNTHDFQSVPAFVPSISGPSSSVRWPVVTTLTLSNAFPLPLGHLKVPPLPKDHVPRGAMRWLPPCHPLVTDSTVPTGRCPPYELRTRPPFFHQLYCKNIYDKIVISSVFVFFFCFFRNLTSDR